MTWSARYSRIAGDKAVEQLDPDLADQLSPQVSEMTEAEHCQLDGARMGAEKIIEYGFPGGGDFHIHLTGHASDVGAAVSVHVTRIARVEGGES